MNNKGQTLVLFLFLLPIFMILFVTIYQIGTMGLEKGKIKDSIKQALEYGVNNINNVSLEEKMREMIIIENPSINEKDIVITTSNNQITVVVTKKYTISFIIEQELVISYTGKKRENKIEIIENRG
jgi:hypothetical protein